MIRNTLLAGVCCVALVGCQTIQDNPNTAVGAGVGALVGAAAGTLVGGDDRRNALIGAGIGLLAGAAIGGYLDQQERELNAGLSGTGAEVERDGVALHTLEHVQPAPHAHAAYDQQQNARHRVC